MKLSNLFRYITKDGVSLIVLLLTVISAINQVSIFMYLLIPFILRGMIWAGQYNDALDKYVTDPAYRQKLGLDTKRVRMPGDIFWGIFFSVLWGGALVAYFIMTRR